MSLAILPLYRQVKSWIEEIPAITEVRPVAYSIEDNPPKDALGRLTSYATLSFGQPVVLEGGRVLNSTDQKHPHLIPFSVYLYSDVRKYEALVEANDELTKKLLDAKPGGDDSQGITGGWGYSYPIPTTDSMPNRLEMPRFFTVIANMAPDPTS